MPPATTGKQNIFVITILHFRTDRSHYDKAKKPQACFMKWFEEEENHPCCYTSLGCASGMHYMVTDTY